MNYGELLNFSSFRNRITCYWFNFLLFNRNNIISF